MSFWSRIERRLNDLADELLPDAWTERLAEARRDLEAGHADRAARLLEELVSERSEQAPAHCLLGAARLDLGELELARQAFERSIEIHSGLVDGYLGRGEARLRLGEIDSALEDFRRAQQLAGGERYVLGLAYRGLGLAHRHQGDNDRAVRELRKSLAEGPDEVTVMAALGDVLVRIGGSALGEARRHLSRAAQSESAPATALLALGRLALADHDAISARDWFERARKRVEQRDQLIPPDSAGDGVSALDGLARVALMLGNPSEARQHLDDALAIDDSRSDLWDHLGQALTSLGQTAEAHKAYMAALDKGGGHGVQERALIAAMSAGDLAFAVPLASRILDRDPGDPVGLVARGRALIRSGELDQARTALVSALARDERGEASCALAELELDAGHAEAAARWALESLQRQPRSEPRRQLLARARAQQLAISQVPPGEDASELLYRVADDLTRVLGTRGDFADLAGETTRAAAELDQPLLVTVMGEFSSGKSTFVNAFLGEDVAPTGITPTTATIHRLKYGRERAGRIVYRDGHTEQVPWAELFERLRAIDTEAARRIQLVEILVPLESLTQVNLVDTPGLNSIQPEHEEVAQNFLARADAVVWLFSAQQAGKASERQALTQLREQGIRVLGVLNKIDQLGEADRAAAAAHVERELDGLVEAVVPVSARRAMEQPERDPDWLALRRILDQRFFDRARQIKRQVLARRLRRSLHQANRRVGAERDAASRLGQQLSAAAHHARQAAEHFFDHTVTLERRRLLEGASDLFRRAAREMLELVIPRRLPFGSHKASRADRDYLLALLDSGLADVLDESRTRIAAELRRAGDRVLEQANPDSDGTTPEELAEIARWLSDSLAMVEARVFTQTQAYVRGYLAGGYVDSFFRHDLPRLQLDEDNVYHALFRDAPDLDAVISVPLAEAGMETLTRMAEDLDRLADRAELSAFDLEVGLGSALATLESRVTEQQ